MKHNAVKKFFNDTCALNKRYCPVLGFYFSGVFMHGVPEEKCFIFTSIFHNFHCKIRPKIPL